MIVGVLGLFLIAHEGPAAEEVAFVRDGQICLVDVGTGADRQLTTVGPNLHPAWSPDGTMLAYERWDFGNSDIYVLGIDVQSGPIEWLHTGDAAHDFFGAWSPDSTQIAFHSGRIDTNQVWTLAADGSDNDNAERITTVATNWRPDWSPDGLEMVYTSQRVGGANDLFAMTLATGAETNPTLGAADADYASWAPDGSGIAFWSSGEAVVIDAASGAVLASTPTDDEFSGATPFRRVAWEPDGSTLLFGYGQHVYKMSSDGASLVSLTEGAAGSSGYPTWSPDGSRIAFVTDRDGSPQVWMMNADGSNEEALTTVSTGSYVDTWPAWRPIVPEIGVAPESLDFGEAQIGTPKPLDVIVTSTGTAALTVSDITSDNPTFTVSTDPPPPFDLLPSDPGRTVTVTSTPTAAGAQTANITITHNAGGGSTVVPVTGTGVLSPTVTITAPAAEEALPAGTTETPLTVAITDHPESGYWGWQLDSGSGPGPLNPVHSGNTVPVPGLADGGSYTLAVSLLDDADAPFDPPVTDSVSFSVDTGEGAADAATIVDSQGSAGDQVVVPITIFDVAPASAVVSGIDLTVTYDATLLTPASDGTGTIAAEAGEVVPDEWSLEQNVTTPGELEIVLAGAFDKQLTGAGTLVHVTFTVDAAAVTNTTTPVGLSRARLNDGQVASTPVGGTFTVVNFMYGDVTGNGDWGGFDGAHVLEHVARELLDGSHTFPVELTAPVWAPLPLTHAEAEEVANVDGDVTPDPAYPNDPEKTVPDVTAMDASLILQRAVGRIDVYPVGEPSASPGIASATVAFGLRGGATSARPGGQVTVTLDVSPASAVYAGEFVLDFDGALLRPTDVSLRRDVVADGTHRALLVQREGDGHVAVAFASARPIEASDALLEVTFEATRAVSHMRESVIHASHLRLNGAKVETDFVFPFRVEPFRTRVMANYPNPFNPETWIPFELAADSDVTVRVYGLDGTVVRTLDLGRRAMGEYRERDEAAYWDGRNETGERVSSGVYVYELTAGDERRVGRMTILK
ncbi:hypothetical protein CMK11_02005 [Candidatus Poribacteria bacterium]|nr:hypothetical protein [Candidatus Poribacteria bacterium]